MKGEVAESYRSAQPKMWQVGKFKIVVADCKML